MPVKKAIIGRYVMASDLELLAAANRGDDGYVRFFHINKSTVYTECKGRNPGRKVNLKIGPTENLSSPLLEVKNGCLSAKTVDLALSGKKVNVVIGKHAASSIEIDGWRTVYISLETVEE